MNVLKGMGYFVISEEIEANVGIIKARRSEVIFNS
jgi:hypothetical protein